MEILVLLLLILLNALFAMSEMAVVSSRKVRLQRRADQGKPGSRAALVLAREPTNFLSTIQVGITVIAITSGAFGEATIAKEVELWLLEWPSLAAHAEGLADAVVICGITVASVIVGELVPKRLALLNPEVIASAIAAPMMFLSRATYPLVKGLTAATEGILAVLGLRHISQPEVTEEDITGLMEQGAAAGVFGTHERALVSRVFRLDRLKVAAVMTPRVDIVWLDLEASADHNLRRVVESGRSRFPIGRGGLDTIVGMAVAKNLLAEAVWGNSIRLQEHVVRPLYVHSDITLIELVESFRQHKQTFALVTSEHGSLLGLVTLWDVMEALAGDIAGITHADERDVVRREDGSWLVDGTTPIDQMKSSLEIRGVLPGETESAFHTAGGFVMHALGRLPAVGDLIEYMDWRFEVLDMDDRRVDKVLVTRRMAGQPALG